MNAVNVVNMLWCSIYGMIMYCHKGLPHDFPTWIWWLHVLPCNWLCYQPYIHRAVDHGGPHGPGPPHFLSRHFKIFLLFMRPSMFAQFRKSRSQSQVSPIIAAPACSAPPIPLYCSSNVAMCGWLHCWLILITSHLESAKGSRSV